MFEVIAGSGHCGTMWLSRVLDSVPGRAWFHEKKTECTGLPWWVADLYAPFSQAFDEYWAFARKHVEAGHFGDSNSWPPESLPDVHQVLPIDRVIYLTRDKEAQLRSLTTASPIWSRAIYTEAAKRRLDLYAKISGRPRDVRLLVEANDFMPVWLQQQGLNVEVYRLEKLTKDLGELKKLAPLTDVELVAWQQRKINSKQGQKMYADYANKMFSPEANK